MARLLPSRRRLARSAFYLTALCLGALIAHLTGSSARGSRSAAGATASIPQLTAALPNALGPERAAASDALARPAPALESVPSLLGSAEPGAQQAPQAPSDTAQPRGSADYRDGLIIDGTTSHRLILFTFDDGPDRRTTPLLLDRLDAVGVKAVFFLTASRIAGTTPREREEADIAREIQARGHLIGSHTVDHLQLPMLDEAQLHQQIEGAETIFQRVLGFRPSLLRPPGGSRSTRTDELLAARHYTTVLWNLSAGDPQVHTPQDVLEVFRKVLERRERENGERGGILLLHDTHAWTVDAFQLIWAELWKRNCKLLAQGEELYDIVPDLSLFYQPRGAAPAGFIAAPAEPDAAVIAERQARLRAQAKSRCNASDAF